MTMKWGPWIKPDGMGRPEGLKDDQMIEAVFINYKGELKTDSFSRPAGHHTWEGTLAYRVEQVETNHVLYGVVGTEFSLERRIYDTHKITYTVNQDGDVLSCNMERLK